MLAQYVSRASQQLLAGLVQWLRKAPPAEVNAVADQVEHWTDRERRRRWIVIADDKGRSGAALLRKLPRIRLPKRPPRQDGR